MNLNFKCKKCPKRSIECIRIAKKDRDKPNDGKTHHIKSDTLCWCCKKSVEGGCDWIDKQTPVKHWDADLMRHKSFTAYHVNDCPEFERG